MKIRLSNTQFLDAQGVPLDGGRVSVYLNDSSTPATLYEVAGDTYVQTANPQTCGVGGFIPAVYFDAALVSVVVEKANGDGTYSVVDTYTDGFSVDAGSNPEGIVEGLAGLKDVEPSSGMVVQVHVNGLVLPYVYDPNCTATADDGVVVASDHGNGRWILMYDRESLPCTVYGIVPGDEANISAFLQFPDHIGQWDIRTPSKARFLGGTYTSNAVFSSTRCLVFDADAMFTLASFSVPCAEVTPSGNYVADFLFTRQGVAESGWFRTLKRFWTCGAETLHIGDDNFTDKTIDAVVSVNGKTVTGVGRIAPTYTTDGYFHFSGCRILAKGFLAAEGERVKFSGCRWDDAWWTSIALASRFNFIALSGTYSGAFVDFRSINSNTIDIDDFGNADIFVKAAIVDVTSNALLDTRLFLRGRKLTNLTASCFTEIHDAVIDACEFACSEITLQNVFTDSLKFNGNNLFLDNCGVELADGCTLSTLTAYDSKIYKATPLEVFPTVSAYRCDWRVSMAAAMDNETDTNRMAFEGCMVHDSVFLHKHLGFFNCALTNCQVGVYPYKEGGVYKMNFVMEGCSLISTSPVVLNKISDPADDCNEITPDIRIVNNVFSGNAIGIRAPLYSSITNRSLFFKGGALSGFVYSGNGGVCPADSAQATLSDAWASTTAYDTTLSASGYVSPTEIRAVPTYSTRNPMTTLAFGKFTQEYELENEVDLTALEKVGKHIVHSVQLTPWATDEYNDFFSLRYYDSSDPNKLIVLM